MSDQDVLVEVLAKAIAFHELRDFGNALRWPQYKGDWIRDRHGQVAIEWPYAEKCRALARVLIPVFRDAQISAET
jgi:hypothetical protein